MRITTLGRIRNAGKAQLCRAASRGPSVPCGSARRGLFARDGVHRVWHYIESIVVRVLFGTWGGTGAGGCSFLLLLGDRSEL
jgi:hypothetical protein